MAVMDEPILSCEDRLSETSGVAKSLIGFGSGSLGFVAAKAAVLFLPLMLSKIWSLRDYGMFEYSMAWGTLLAVPLGVGSTGAIPYFLLQRNRPKYLGAFEFHSLLTGLCLSILTAAYLMFGFNMTAYVVLLVTGILVVQGIRATIYKVANAPVRASTVESGVYVVLLLLAISLGLMGTRLSLKLFLGTLNVYALFLVATSVRRSFWTVAWRNHVLRYQKALVFGLPVIATSAAIIFLVSSTRLLAGRIFSLEAVGTYSFFFRISSPVILLHSLLTTIYFRKLYQSEARTLDYYFSIILLGAFILGILMFLTIPPLLGARFPLLHDLGGANRNVYFLLCIQMVFWIAIALGEAIIYRQNRAKEFTWVLTVTIISLLIATGLLKSIGLLTLLRLAQLQMGSMFLAFCAQAYILQRSGMPLKKTPALVVVVMGVYLFCAPFLNS